MGAARRGRRPRRPPMHTRQPRRPVERASRGQALMQRPQSRQVLRSMDGLRLTNLTAFSGQAAAQGGAVLSFAQGSAPGQAGAFNSGRYTAMRPRSAMCGLEQALAQPARDTLNASCRRMTPPVFSAAKAGHSLPSTAARRAAKSSSPRPAPASSPSRAARRARGPVPARSRQAPRRR